MLAQGTGPRTARGRARSGPGRRRNAAGPLGAAGTPHGPRPAQAARTARRPAALTVPTPHRLGPAGPPDGAAAQRVPRRGTAARAAPRAGPRSGRRPHSQLPQRFRRSAPLGAGRRKGRSPSTKPGPAARGREPRKRPRFSPRRARPGRNALPVPEPRPPPTPDAPLRPCPAPPPPAGSGPGTAPRTYRRRRPRRSRAARCLPRPRSGLSPLAWRGGRARRARCPSRCRSRSGLGPASWRPRAAAPMEPAAPRRPLRRGDVGASAPAPPPYCAQKRRGTNALRGVRAVMLRAAAHSEERGEGRGREWRWTEMGIAMGTGTGREMGIGTETGMGRGMETETGTGVD